MYSNEPNYKSYIEGINEWNEKGNTSKCSVMHYSKKDAVKIANAIKCEGYTVTLADAPRGLYEIIVEKKYT